MKTLAAAALLALTLTACPDDVAKLRGDPTPASPAPAVDPNATPTPTISVSPVPAASATP